VDEYGTGQNQGDDGGGIADYSNSMDIDRKLTLNVSISVQFPSDRSRIKIFQQYCLEYSSRT
jgi:hypothetical protein